MGIATVFAANMAARSSASGVRPRGHGLLAIVHGRLARIDGQRRSRAQSGHEHSNEAQFGRKNQTKGALFPCRPKCHARSTVHMERMKKGPGFGIHADSRPNRGVEFQIFGGLPAARLSVVMHWKAQ